MLGRFVLGLGLALAAWWQVYPTSAADAPCTFEQMEIDARSVISPCSALIEDETLRPEVRADALFARGRAYARTGRTGLAAQDYDVAIKLSPTKSDYYVSRASTEVRAGDYDDAFTDLDRALSIDPRNARAYRALGGLYEDYGRLDDAMRFASKALSLDPHEPYALLLRIELFEHKRQFVEALVDANTLVDIPSGEINRLGFVDQRGWLRDFHAQALVTRSALATSMGDYAAAFRDLDASIAQAPSAPEYRSRGDLWLMQGRNEEALRDYDAAIALEPDNAYAQSGRGLVFLGLKKGDAALDALDKALAALGPTSRDGYMVASTSRYRARALRLLGRTDDAVQAIETAVSTNDEVKYETSLAMAALGYWSKTDLTPLVTSDYKAALRACMIDADCN